MATTIKVAYATKAKVKQLKRSLNIGSADGVIVRLVDAMDNVLPAQGHQNVAMNAPHNADEEKKRTQFFSYAALAQEPSTLKYYTGLKANAQSWLWQELQKLVCMFCFFCCFGRVSYRHDIYCH